ncbi:hypothetical protein J6590_029331 [Homalodisca vitripennis]|nr:hypothetical protein J6590_029331 [Homalodisca vitripennis]
MKKTLCQQVGATNHTMLMFQWICLDSHFQEILPSRMMIDRSPEMIAPDFSFGAILNLNERIRHGISKHSFVDETERQGQATSQTRYNVENSTAAAFINITKTNEIYEKYSKDEKVKSENFAEILLPEHVMLRSIPIVKLTGSGIEREAGRRDHAVHSTKQWSHRAIGPRHTESTHLYLDITGTILKTASKYEDENIALKVDMEFMISPLRCGTSAVYFATTHYNSNMVNLTEIAFSKQRRAWIGKVNMDNNFPINIIKSCQ